jgi:hypothetical protein
MHFAGINTDRREQVIIATIRRHVRYSVNINWTQKLQTVFSEWAIEIK